MSASDLEALDPRAKPVPLSQTAGLETGFKSISNPIFPVAVSAFGPLPPRPHEDAVAKPIDVLNGLAGDPERDVADLLWGKADKP